MDGGEEQRPESLKAREDVDSGSLGTLCRGSTRGTPRKRHLETATCGDSARNLQSCRCVSKTISEVAKGQSDS